MPSIIQAPSGCGCVSAGSPCPVCDIPLADLTLSWVDRGDFTTPGSTTLFYLGPAHGYPFGGDYWVTDHYFMDGSLNSGWWRTWLYCGAFGPETNSIGPGVFGSALNWIGGADTQTPDTGTTCGPFHEVLTADFASNIGLIYIDE